MINMKHILNGRYVKNKFMIYLRISRIKKILNML